VCKNVFKMPHMSSAALKYEPTISHPRLQIQQFAIVNALQVTQLDPIIKPILYFTNEYMLCMKCVQLYKYKQCCLASHLPAAYGVIVTPAPLPPSLNFRC
jgi:hypothetical protein